MTLDLDREDLQDEKRDTACSKTSFDDFKPDVQTAIQAVGRATFYDRKGSDQENYNAIYPPTV